MQKKIRVPALGIFLCMSTISGHGYGEKILDYVRSFKAVDTIFKNIELSESLNSLKKGDESRRLEIFIKYLAIPALQDGAKLLDPRNTIVGKVFWAGVIATGMIHAIRPFDEPALEIILIHRWLKKNPKIKLSFSVNSPWDVQRLIAKFPDQPWWHEAGEQELQTLYQWNRLHDVVKKINNIPLMIAIGFSVLSGCKRFGVITNRLAQLKAAQI